MKTFDILQTSYKVSDFLSWQREGRLVLSPTFQRRPVWSAGAKSYLIDTVARGLPVPVVFIRDRIRLESRDAIREVVDGQQRLRTLISFIEPEALSDYSASRDAFTVKAVHNKELAGRPFGQLPDDVQSRLLDYEFSTQVLPRNTDDREVLEIFARMNSTGLKLNGQEIRNASWFGLFKTLMYELALEQLDRWRQWRILRDDQISRMREVELTSDLVLNIIEGLTGRSQARLDSTYKRYDEDFPNKEPVADRYRKTMDTIDRLVGPDLSTSAFKSEVNFFTLFVFVYDRLYGIGSDLGKRRPRPLPDSLSRCLMEVSDRIQSRNVPANVLDAIERASADTGRRRTRFDFMSAMCDGPA